MPPPSPPQASMLLSAPSFPLPANEASCPACTVLRRNLGELLLHDSWPLLVCMPRCRVPPRAEQPGHAGTPGRCPAGGRVTACPHPRQDLKAAAVSQALNDCVHETVDIDDNNCFEGAIIQCLWHCPCFRKAVTQRPLHAYQVRAATAAHRCGL